MDIGHSTAHARPAARESRQTPSDIDWEALSTWAGPAPAGWLVVVGGAPVDRPAAA